MANRRPEKAIEHYSTELPEGVRLQRIFSTRSYQIRRGSELLASRRLETVLMWKNPARVFASIARRAIRERAKK